MPFAPDPQGRDLSSLFMIPTPLQLRWQCYSSWSQRQEDKQWPTRMPEQICVSESTFPHFFDLQGSVAGHARSSTTVRQKGSGLAYAGRLPKPCEAAEVGVAHESKRQDRYGPCAIEVIEGAWP